MVQDTKRYVYKLPISRVKQLVAIAIASGVVGVLLSVLKARAIYESGVVGSPGNVITLGFILGLGFGICIAIFSVLAIARTSNKI